jgi:hypothetical protein
MQLAEDMIFVIQETHSDQFAMPFLSPKSAMLLAHARYQTVAAI